MRIVTPNNYDLEALRASIEYDSLTGVFTSKVRLASHVPAGKVMGVVGPDGYRRIAFRYSRQLAHRLAWFYVYGVWPTGELDHINEVKDDNRIDNLRLADRSNNMRNVSHARTDSITGVRGVAKRGKKWRPHISRRGKMRYLGSFDSLEEALEARRKAEIEIRMSHEA